MAWAIHLPSRGFKISQVSKTRQKAIASMKYRKTNIIFFLKCGTLNPHFIKIIIRTSISHIRTLKNVYPNLQEKFGERLKKLRTEKKISLRELSSKCELDDSQISKIENGKKNVQLSTIFELARGLEVEPKELLDFKI